MYIEHGKSVIKNIYKKIYPPKQRYEDKNHFFQKKNSDRKIKETMSNIYCFRDPHRFN